MRRARRGLTPTDQLPHLDEVGATVVARTRFTGLVAKYPGRCPTCPDPILPGQRIKYDQDGDLVHFSHRREYRPTTILGYRPCSVCHLVGPLNSANICPDCVGWGD